MEAEKNPGEPVSDASAPVYFGNLTEATGIARGWPYFFGEKFFPSHPGAS
jgi:hypothetical protein